MPFRFVHVYGRIDAPTWRGGVEYGIDFDLTRIQKCAKNIKVIGERANEWKEDIYRLFQNANYIMLSDELSLRFSS